MYKANTSASISDLLVITHIQEDLCRHSAHRSRCCMLSIHITDSRRCVAPVKANLIKTGFIANNKGDIAVDITFIVPYR